MIVGRKAFIAFAIVPTFLVRQGFASDTLVPLFDLLVNDRCGEALPYPDDRAGYSPGMLFRDWLLAAFNRDGRESDGGKADVVLARPSV